MTKSCSGQSETYTYSRSRYKSQNSDIALHAN
uniref:Uncharacterized protein n=1 Tax=Arundo donax TaxID=35708 RepID=A0A0A9AU53_ARUDO